MCKSLKSSDKNSERIEGKTTKIKLKYDLEQTLT